MTTIQFLSLSKGQRFGIKFLDFFKGLGRGIAGFFKRLPHKFMMWGHKLSHPFKVLWDAFIRGTWFTKGNFLVFGFSQLFHREFFRGILYLLYEIVFLWFFFTVGIGYLDKLTTLGTFSQANIGPNGVKEGGDFSVYIMLYSLITIFLLLVFVVLWYFSIRDAKSLQDNIAVGHLSKNSQFFKDLTDKSYHTLLLAIPLVGLVAFTIIPIVFMILIGFTNYTGNTHGDLFDWVALDNFNNLFSSMSGQGDMLNIFLRVLAWTLMWALIATLTNYFLGMIIALLINRKGIKLKKMWRTILITTIAVPQFVSLLLINRMLSNNGFLTKLFVDWGWVAHNSSPFDYILLSRILIIVVNMWVGVPYTMLICSGLLMNIPEDLYESARIDGASPWKMYMKITLPYMLFITMPYLISQFVGNINNFNIIYLLSQGAPKFEGASESLGGVGHTDLLITWIYKMSMGDKANYALACVLGLLIFVIIAFLSLLFYGRSSSVKNEGDFQ